VITREEATTLILAAKQDTTGFTGLRYSPLFDQFPMVVLSGVSAQMSGTSLFFVFLPVMSYWNSFPHGSTSDSGHRIFASTAS